MKESIGEYCIDCGEEILFEYTMYGKIRYCGCKDPKPLFKKVIKQPTTLKFEEQQI